MTGDTIDAVDDGRPPLLFVHGLGHGAWCWEHWLGAAADAGYPASRLGRYVDDVVATAAAAAGPRRTLDGRPGRAEG